MSDKAVAAGAVVPDDRETIQLRSLLTVAEHPPARQLTAKVRDAKVVSSGRSWACLFFMMMDAVTMLRRKLAVGVMAVLSCLSCGLVPAQTPAPARSSSTVIRRLAVPSQSRSVQSLAPGSVNPVIITPDGLVAAPGATPQAEADPAAATAANPVDTQLKQQTTQLLQQLTFDRRPSSILRAWALPEDEILKPAEATPPAAAAPAAPTAAPEEVAGAELTEEQKAAAAAAATAAAAAQQQATELQQKLADFQHNLNRLKLLVTKGQWPAVAELLQKFDEADRRIIYNQLLTSLIQGPPDAPRTRDGQIIGERNLLQAGDVVAIGELCPDEKLSIPQTSQLGALVVACQNEGEADDAFPEVIRAHVADSAAAKQITSRVAARILFAAARADEALAFLPSLETAQADKDAEALDLLSDTFLAIHSKGGSPEDLENAWHAVQAVLELEAPPETDTQTASPGEPPAEATTSETTTIPDDAVAATTTAADTPPAETVPVDGNAGQQESTPAAAPGAARTMTRAEFEQMQQKALRRAVQLVPRLRQELGQQWLTDSFTREPERGRRILNGIGTAAAKNMAESAFDTESRVQTLKLQQTAVESVLAHAEASGVDWSAALHLMAVNWLREAMYSSLYDTSTSRGPRMQRDAYGNYFWTEDNVSFGRQVQNGMPQAIPSGRLLDARPSDAWLKFLEPSFYPTLAMATARLHLRVKEEAEAFPYIESLASTHAEEATELVRDFFSVWADNHDPNSERRRTGVYMFSFGYNQQLSGIPLTRSHQERNLKELAGWVSRIRALPLEDIDETWISSAFTRVHSAAEVYRLDDLEAVFGSVDAMEAETLASLLLTMRSNLNTVWRMPQVQQEAQTNRRKKDIEAEVMGGYDTALKMCDDGLQKHPEHWRLLMARGSLLHDLANYRNDIEKSTEYTESRRSALQVLHDSARSYVAQVPELKEGDFSVEAFNTWFYAALGDSDIGRIDQQRSPMLDQMPLIEAAMASLPEESAEKHRDMFANDLFARMSSVNPAVKFRYVREGLSLAGDRMQAREARQVFDYYNDLVTEIQLKAELDGTPRVGNEQPFGVLVSIRHTKAIEREAGGFTRYLQNQNSGGGYYYNNGRPNEDYRDKFEEATRDAVDEHFEVLSVTFEPENIHSRPEAELGWRVTPYAYVLLKARGPEVDRIPPFRLDLDFLDTTGYVVLPVESAPISVDCSSSQGDPRPLTNLSLTQTLDEREAKDGKLVLEIKATGQGLIPELSQLVDLTFDDFEVTEIDDNKLSISRFDPDSSDPVVLSERLWTVTLQDRSEQTAEVTREFRFPASIAETKEVIYQRYDDADLKAVEQLVELENTYDEPDRSPVITASITVLALALLAVVGTIWYRSLSRRGQPEVQAAWAVPEHVTPFSVLSLLRNIERNNGLSSGARTELNTAIHRIEKYYFSPGPEGDEPDLVAEASTWVRKAR